MNSKEPDVVYVYDAFISYRHGDIDGIVAERLHKELESYTLPIELRKLGYPKKINRIFRDREELPTSPSLTNSITEALRLSRYLIVVCSPRTPESKWVLKEIEYFKELGRSDRILVLLIKGEPKEAFPPALYRIARTIKNTDGSEQEFIEEIEPLGGDIRSTSTRKILKILKSEKLRLLAPIVGCSYDDIFQRHRKLQKQKLRKTAALCASIFIVFAISFLIIMSHWASYSKNLAKQNIDVSLKNLNERHIILNQKYQLMKTMDKQWKENLDAEPTLAEATVPLQMKNQCIENESDLNKLGREYPVSYGQKITLPAFADLHGDIGKDASHFGKQLELLDQSWNSIETELERESGYTDNIDLSIQQDKLVILKMRNYLLQSKIAYLEGITAIKHFSASDYENLTKRYNKDMLADVN